MKHTPLIINREVNAIRLYGVVGSDENEISFEHFSYMFKDLAEYGDITLYINSPGGNMFDGLAIYDLIKNTNVKVTAIVEGIAASIAGVILQACDVRKITENGRIMIHKASAVTSGDSEDHEQSLQLIKDEEVKIINIFEKRTGKEKEVVESWLKKGVNKWFNAKDAKENNLVDEIIEPAVKVATTNNKSATELFNIFNSGLIHSEPNQEKENMKKNLLLNSFAKFGIDNQLNETSTDEAFVQVVNNVLSKLKATEDQNLELKNALKKQEENQIKEIIKNAKEAKKIDDSSEAHWTKLLNLDLEAGKKALEGIVVNLEIPINKTGKPVDGVPSNRADWTYTKWSQEDPQGLARLRNEDPETFKQILKK